MAAPVCTYTDDVGIEICARLAAGESLVTICKHPLMPTAMCVYNWLQRHPHFKAMYDDARIQQADFYADAIIEIANNTETGTTIKTRDDGSTEIIEGDMIQHRRLKIDALKWYASKVAPMRWGDRTVVDTKVDITIHQAREVSDADLMRVIDGAGLIRTIDIPEPPDGIESDPSGD